MAANAINQAPGGCGCGPPVCTDGFCAVLTNYAPATGTRLCGICTTPGLATITVKNSGTVLFTGSMTWAGNHFASPLIFLSNHWIDHTGADLGTQNDVYEFYPDGGGGGTAYVIDHLNPSTFLTIGDDRTWHLIHGVDPYTCDGTGFHAHYSIPPDPGGYVALGFAGYLNRYLGATDLYIDIALSAQGCLCEIQVQGCNSLALAGATVTVKNVGGTVLDSGTSDASGNFFTGSGCGSNQTVIVSGSRLATTTIGGQVLAINAPTAVGISGPASGYTCIPGCALPLANTIHATFSTAGLVTLVNSGSGWTATGTVSGQTYVISFDGTTWTITRNGVSCGAIGWSVVSCPPSFLGSLTVPAGACTTELGSTATVTE